MSKHFESGSAFKGDESRCHHGFRMRGGWRTTGHGLHPRAAAEFRQRQSG